MFIEYSATSVKVTNITRTAVVSGGKMPLETNVFQNDCISFGAFHISAVRIRNSFTIGPVWNRWRHRTIDFASTSWRDRRTVVDAYDVIYLFFFFFQHYFILTLASSFRGFFHLRRVRIPTRTAIPTDDVNAPKLFELSFGKIKKRPIQLAWWNRSPRPA